MSAATGPALIGPDELAELLTGDRPVSLLDVRFDPAVAAEHDTGRAEWLAGHLPGAVYVDLRAELSGPPAPGQGRRPLPAPDRLHAALRRWGVRRDSHVVAYDDRAGRSAGRAWWVLRWAGLPSVRILDGGLAAWRRAGLPLDSGPVQVAPGDAEVRPGQLPVLDAGGAADLAGRGLLLDARTAEDYAAGHIPGARSHPAATQLTENGAVVSPEDIRAGVAEVRSIGTDVVGAYCGGGVAGAFLVATLAHAGISAALYPGSFSAWTQDPARPVATGPDQAQSLEAGR